MAVSHVATYIDQGGGTENVTINGTGSDRLLLGLITGQSASVETGTGITIGGVSVADLENVSVDGSGVAINSMFGHIVDANDPAAGTQTMDGVWGSEAGNQIYAAIELAGVDQTTPRGTTASATYTDQANGATVSVTLDNHASKAAIVYVASTSAGSNDGNGGHTLPAGATSLGEWYYDKNRVHVGYIQSIGSNSEQLDFTVSADGSSVLNGVAVAAIPIFAVGEAAANSDPALDTPISDIIVPSNTSGTIADISGNFSDADSDPLTYSVTPALPSGMTLNTTTGVISGNGSITVTAAADYTFSADDGNGGTPASDVVSITVTAPAFSVDSVSGGDQPDESWVFALSNDSGAGMTANIGGAALTVTAQTSGSITVTIPDLLTFAGGIHRFSENLTVQIVDGGNSDTIDTPVTPATGFAQVQMPDPIAGVWASSTFEAAISPAVLAIGDYIHCTAPTDSDPANGVFPEDSTIVYNIMDMSDPTPVWGTSGIITVATPNNAATGVPVLTGTLEEGQSLGVDTSGITDADGIGSFSYQWTRDASNISGATSSTYTLTQTDVDTVTNVVVSFTDGAGNAESVVSTNSTAVSNVNDLPTGSVSIDNTSPAVGDTLTASNTLVDEDGLGTITYTWYKDGGSTGSTGTTYVVVEGDVGGILSVVASYIDSQGTSESVSSANTNTVVPTPDVTAPVLSSPTATVNGAYAATGTVSTDESGGTLYVLVSTNSTETSATIKASINNQPVVSTGTQNISASGLSPETTYYIHYVQVDSAGNTSNVVSSTSFTTEAATSGGFDSWDEWMASLDAGTFTTKLRTFLQGKGYSGSTSTMLYEYLKTVSSKASHQERKKDWEEGGWN